MTTTINDWNARANNVVRECASKGVELIFRGGTVYPSENDPRFVKMRFLPGATTRVSNVRQLKDDISLALNERDVRVTMADGMISVEISRQSSILVRYEDIVKSLNLKPMNAFLGVGVSGEYVSADMSTPQACHAMIIGMSGCGKTTLAQSMVASMCAYTDPKELQLVLFDPKNDDKFAGHIADHVWGHAVTTDECRRGLRNLVAMMRNREKRTARIIVYCDEVNELVADGGDDVAESLEHIANMGRGHGIHLLICGQHPKNDTMPGAIRANMPLKILGRNSSAFMSAHAAGVSGTGAERLSGGGDFIAAYGGNQSVQFQAPLFTATERKNYTNFLMTQASPQAVQAECISNNDANNVVTDVDDPGDIDDDLGLLISRISAVLTAAPGDLSKDEISRRASGKRVVGTSYKKKFDKALEIAKKSREGWTM